MVVSSFCACFQTHTRANSSTYPTEGCRERSMSEHARSQNGPAHSTQSLLVSVPSFTAPPASPSSLRCRLCPMHLIPVAPWQFSHVHRCLISYLLTGMKGRQRTLAHVSEKPNEDVSFLPYSWPSLALPHYYTIRLAIPGWVRLVSPCHRAGPSIQAEVPKGHFPFCYPHGSYSSSKTDLKNQVTFSPPECSWHFSSMLPSGSAEPLELYIIPRVQTVILASPVQLSLIKHV